MNDDEVLCLIRSQFPQLGPVAVTTRAQGMDNYAFEINGEWIFRFPQRPEGEPFLQMELRLLPHIQDRLPVAIPHYELVGHAPDRNPAVFAGYRKLPGVPGLQLSPQDIPALGRAIGELLGAIHAFPAEQAVELGAWVAPPDDDAEKIDEARQTLADLGSELREPLHRAIEVALSVAVPPFAGPPRFLHADFSAEHYLVDPASGALTGLIDWSDAAVGDPANEFSYLWTWPGPELVAAALQHYHGPVDPGLPDRIRVFGLCTAIADLHYGLTTGVEYNRRAGMAALERECGASTT